MSAECFKIWGLFIGIFITFTILYILLTLNVSLKQHKRLNGISLHASDKKSLKYRIEIILLFIILDTFSYSCNGRESIVFVSNFRNGDFDGFTRREDP